MNFTYLLATLALFSTSTTADTNSTCDYIFTIIGGSTAANTGSNINFIETNNVLMWNNSTFNWQNAKYPLLGSYGSGSSPWLLFAKNVSVTHNNAKVCLIGNAHHAAVISDYSNGKYTEYLINAYNVMNIYPNAHKCVICMLGEQNANYDYYSSNYYSDLKKLIEYGNMFNTTWLVSQTSYNPFNVYYIEDKVRNAQYDVVNSNDLNNVYAGPNTDTLCHQYRYNGLYFNEHGINKLSTYWLKSFNNQTHNFHPDNNHCDYRYISPMVAFSVFIFILAIISGALAAVLMCIYYIKENSYDRKVYYYIYSVNNREKTSLLSEDKV
jgi:hypothetical protein